jgi:hypothetical protein
MRVRPHLYLWQSVIAPVAAAGLLTTGRARVGDESLAGGRFRCVICFGNWPTLPCRFLTAAAGGGTTRESPSWGRRSVSVDWAGRRRDCF